MRTVLLAVVLAVPAWAATDESAGSIAKKARERGALNLAGLSAQLRMVTTARDGRVKEQVLATASKRIDGKMRSISRFMSPAPVSGVAVLSVEGGPGEGSDVSLYLPKLKKVRKVAKSDRGKSFMDTDFSYADLGAGAIAEEGAKRLPDEKLDGKATFVLDAAGGTDSPYSRLMVWVDAQSYVPVKVDYFDKDGKVTKRFTAQKLQTFKDRIFATQSVMENVATGSKTEVTVLKLEDLTVGDEAFTERALERG